MKRLATVLLVIAMLVTLAGCELSEDIITTPAEASTTETANPPQNSETTEQTALPSKSDEKAQAARKQQRKASPLLLRQKARDRQILRPLSYKIIRALKSTILMLVRLMPPSSFATVRPCS